MLWCPSQGQVPFVPEFFDGAAIGLSDAQLIPQRQDAAERDVPLVQEDSSQHLEAVGVEDE